MELEPEPRHPLFMRVIRGEDDVMTALAQLQANGDERMQIAEGTVGGENDALRGHAAAKYDSAYRVPA
jgi:hypothetical protein